VDKIQKTQAINIMFLHYDNYEPWCKVLQLEDFDETNFTGSLAVMINKIRTWNTDNVGKTVPIAIGSTRLKTDWNARLTGRPPVPVRTGAGR
jgi:hypothetical protein